jgi:hypothetical protein
MIPRQDLQPNQVRVGSKSSLRFPHQVPLELLNGLVVNKSNRKPPSSDWDQTPIGFRRFVNTGTQDVQIWNGLRHRVATGYRFAYPGAGYLYAYAPVMPGSAWTPATYGGTHKRGIDPLSYARLQREGPGSQPANPGGPGKIAGTSYHNPMTG